MNPPAGLLGICVFIGVAWLFSENRRLFPWRTVLAGLGLQVALAWTILRTRAGEAVFERLDALFRRLMLFSSEGTAMVFGPLANPELLAEKWGSENAFLFAVSVTGTIILVSSLSSLFYHYGILQMVVRCLAAVMRLVMRTSGCESLAAAANTFMGQTEAPLLVRPYLAGMTRSELMALMTGGMATIAGGVMAAYVGFGISPGHLLTASVMSAPAALLMAKVMVPETEASGAAGTASCQVEKSAVNGLDALCQGAAEGMKLSVNVMAMLMAFAALVAMSNWLLSKGLLVAGIEEARPLQLVLGWVNAPFAWLMGVPWTDCLVVGGILGERIVLNEFVGYLSLSRMKALQPGSVVITTYALCGFANFASIAIQIGGIGALAESRRAVLAGLGLKAMMAGVLACYCTASIAGLLLR